MFQCELLDHLKWVTQRLRVRMVDFVVAVGDAGSVVAAAMDLGEDGAEVETSEAVVVEEISVEDEEVENSEDVEVSVEDEEEWEALEILRNA